MHKFEGYTVVSEEPKEQTAYDTTSYEISYESTLLRAYLNLDDKDNLPLYLSEWVKTTVKHFSGVFLNSKFAERSQNGINALKEALEEPEINTALTELLGKHAPTLEDLTDLINSRQIPDILFIKILELRQIRLQRKNEAFEQEAEKLKEDFINRVAEEISTGFLPVDLRKAKERLKNIKIVLVDPLLIEDLGSCKDNIIQINANLSPEKIKHAVFHELTHIISGRVSGTREDSLSWEVEYVKLGVRMASIESRDRAPLKRYEWLNEALTETINLKLLGGSDQGFYFIERSRLNSIARHLTDDPSSKPHVPLATFIAAYFEDYDLEPNAFADEIHLPLFDALEEAVLEITGGKLSID
jgi:hypothetical protein